MTGLCRGPAQAVCVAQLPSFPASWPKMLRSWDAPMSEQKMF